jgi:hypothetical protein
MTTTTTTTTPLTVGFALRLGDLLNWVAQGRVVHFVTEGSDIRTGTLRHVVRSEDDYCFLGRGQDVRDAYVRITLTSGFDVALPVTQVVGLIEDGAFAPVDRDR